jgi:hypothetical protein
MRGRLVITSAWVAARSVLDVGVDLLDPFIEGSHPLAASGRSMKAVCAVAITCVWFESRFIRRGAACA